MARAPGCGPIHTSLFSYTLISRRTGVSCLAQTFFDLACSSVQAAKGGGERLSDNCRGVGLALLLKSTGALPAGGPAGVLETVL